MPIFAPIYQLRRKARILCRQENIPLHAALDRIAAGQGFESWSLLVARTPRSISAGDLFSRLSPGDLVLIGARPGQGKTLLSLKLAVEAMKIGNRSMFFTLEYTEKDVTDCFRSIGADPQSFAGLFEFDGSNAIQADYIVTKLMNAPTGSLVVIDYLQLLDHKRENPELIVQLRTLQSFAYEHGLIFVFISQIDRSYNSALKPFPDLQDVRLPNPLDLKLFNKTCFLSNGKTRFRAVG